MLKRSPFEHGTRIEVFIDDAVASSVLVFNRTIRIGSIPLRCGGIGDVSTKRAYRQQGYARLMLEDAVAFMKEDGFHFAALFGIPNFYPKFGFAPAIPGTESTIATRDAELAQARFPIRPMRPEDRPRLAAIYEQMNAVRTLSCVRDPATWDGFRIGAGWNDRIDAFVVLDGEQIIGYASYDLDPWRCAFGEVGYSTPDAWSTILAEAARQALEKRVEKLTIHAPADDPFVHYCRRLGCSTSLYYARNAHGMARLIDQRATLQAVQPLLKQRLERSSAAWRGTLVFATDLGEDAVELGHGAAVVLKLPQTMLTQWLLGYCAVAESIFESAVRVPEQILPALQAIFPTGYPYIYASDRF
ncbi:MAG: GNAT family N-acetyltransferase [Chloroflexi bacterium]|nr:GNAT family N-acetyltransferase [Chloroflexota bacterium]